MKDRFDLEQEILQVKSYADNIRMTAERMINDDHNGTIDIDFYWNALNGIAVLLDMHSDVMFDTMQQCFKLDSYKNSLMEDNNGK
jgi:hypothetical protein